MNSQNLNLGNDPTLQRALADTIQALTDVDHRIQALKQGIVQVLPQLANAFPQQQGFGAGVGFPTTQGFTQGVPQGLGHSLGAPLQGPVGIPGAQPGFGHVPFGSPLFGQGPTNTPLGQQGLAPQQGIFQGQQQGVGIPPFRQF